MDVPSFGTWEMLLYSVLLASDVTVATPCQGFEDQHGLISPFCYLALDITAVTLSSLKEELTLLSRAPDSSGSDSSAISSLCIFGLVDM